MIYRASNHNRAEQQSARCVMCGAALFSANPKSLDRLCLICRAAVLDRIFQARHQQTQTMRRAES